MKKNPQNQKSSETLRHHFRERVVPFECEPDVWSHKPPPGIGGAKKKIQGGEKN